MIAGVSNRAVGQNGVVSGEEESQDYVMANTSFITWGEPERSAALCSPRGQSSPRPEADDKLG